MLSGDLQLILGRGVGKSVDLLEDIELLQGVLPYYKTNLKHPVHPLSFLYNKLSVHDF